MSIFKSCLSNILNVQFLSLPAWLAPGWGSDANITHLQRLCVPEMGPGKSRACPRAADICLWDALLFLLSRPNPQHRSPPTSLHRAENSPSPWSGQWTSCSFKGNLTEGGEDGRQNGNLVHERTFQVPGIASRGKMWVAACILRDLRQGNGSM